MANKRYVRNVYPIAGIRWVQSDEIAGSDGVMINVRRIDTDTQRRTIGDEQYLIQWENLVKRISDDMGTPIAEIVNVGTGRQVFKQKVGRNAELKTIAAGTDVTLTDTGNEIVINFSAGLTGTTQINAAFSLQRPDNPQRGAIFFNIDSSLLEVWNGAEWKIIKFE